jgi:hypothetical protein
VSVEAGFWYDNATWRCYQLAGPGSASTGGGITSVPWLPGAMEVWWVGPDGSIRDAFWYDA